MLEELETKVGNYWVELSDVLLPQAREELQILEFQYNELCWSCDEEDSKLEEIWYQKVKNQKDYINKLENLKSIVSNIWTALIEQNSLNNK